MSSWNLWKWNKKSLFSLFLFSLIEISLISCWSAHRWPIRKVIHSGDGDNSRWHTVMPSGLQTVWSSVGISEQVRHIFLHAVTWLLKKFWPWNRCFFRNLRMFSPFHWFCSGWCNFLTNVYTSKFVFISWIPVSLRIVVGLKSSLVTVMQKHKHNSDKWMARAREKETSGIYCSTHAANDASAFLWCRGLTIIIYILSCV